MQPAFSFVWVYAPIFSTLGLRTHILYFGFMHPYFLPWVYAPVFFVLGLRCGTHNFCLGFTHPYSLLWVYAPVFFILGLCCGTHNFCLGFMHPYFVLDLRTRMVFPFAVIRPYGALFGGTNFRLGYVPIVSYLGFRYVLLWGTPVTFSLGSTHLYPSLLDYPSLLRPLLGSTILHIWVTHL
jgi:hypothetical protein